MPEPSELPQPDLMDRSGRMRRAVLALIVGATVAAAVFAVFTAVVSPEELNRQSYYVSRNMSAAGFRVWLTAISGGVAFALTLVITNLIAKRKWQRERDVPKARLKA